MSERASIAASYRAAGRAAGAKDRLALSIGSVFGLSLRRRGLPWVVLASIPLLGLRAYVELFWVPAGLAFLAVVALVAGWSVVRCCALVQPAGQAGLGIQHVLGMMLTLLLLPPSWWVGLLGCAIYPAMSRWEPYPAKALGGSVRGGLGLLLSAVVVGLWSNLALRPLLSVVSWVVG